MTTKTASLVQQRQAPLCEQYAKSPATARIFDSAHTLNACSGDAFHGTVVPNHGSGSPLRFGIHEAVGGDHDLPNPGDLLCAGLAACLDATLRMVASHMAISLKEVQVKVKAECDVRGCLMVDPGVPVGFQRLYCSVHLVPDGDVEVSKLRKLLAAAESCCVVMQTLRGGVSVLTELEAIEAEGAHAGATEVQV
jgi:uncharacterized OsmC-like protein